MKTVHLTAYDLAQRWQLKNRTIDRWRSEGGGPRYLKIGGRVMYRLEDVEAYEILCFKQETAKDDGAALDQNRLSCVK